MLRKYLVSSSSSGSRACAPPVQWQRTASPIFRFPRKDTHSCENIFLVFQPISHEINMLGPATGTVCGENVALTGRKVRQGSKKAPKRGASRSVTPRPKAECISCSRRFTRCARNDKRCPVGVGHDETVGAGHDETVGAGKGTKKGWPNERSPL